MKNKCEGPSVCESEKKSNAEYGLYIVYVYFKTSCVET
jgi:hypothetical protein